MPNGDAGPTEAPSPKVPETVTTLNLSVKLPDGADIQQIIAAANEFGEVRNLSINTGPDYGYGGLY